MSMLPKQNSYQNLDVYKSEAFRVTNGANLGDAISFASDVVLDDIYGFARVAHQHKINLIRNDDDTFKIGTGSSTGKLGATVHMDSCLTFMSGDGRTTEMLILVEVDGNHDVAEVYFLPLAQMSPDLDYALVGVNREIAQKKLAQVACVSFTRGTNIAMASGAQKPIEELKVGDMVLTRDNGAQEVRWIGQTTVRAHGDFRPVVITAGTLHNVNDLVVSPDHRLFIYQRSDQLGAGRSEVLVKARHLVNDTTVYRMEGGFVDYFQLLFDSHQIIYAEGIAAESLLVDMRTRPVLPKEVSQRLAATLPQHDNAGHQRYEVNDKLLQRPDTADLLRRASTR